MKKYLGYLLIFVAAVYLWFALLPTWLNYSFPTGGWDWLGFIGVIGGIFLSVWSIRKQQQLSVTPYLDVDGYTKFDSNAPNNSFRIFQDRGNKIYNSGYVILRSSKSKENGQPEGFHASANIKVTNKGLSTAFGIVVYLYSLQEVKGLSSLEEIETTLVDDFYDKVRYIDYEYYESTADDAKPIEHSWIILPQYNLCSNSNEFNLVFDFSNIQKKYHSILKFEFQDIYQNKYYQLMYLYFDNRACAVLPISKLYTK